MRKWKQGSGGVKMGGGGVYKTGHCRKSLVEELSNIVDINTLLKNTFSGNLYNIYICII